MKLVFVWGATVSLVCFLASCRGPSSGASTIGVVGISSQFGSGLKKVLATDEIAQQERAMFRRLNRDRATRGLPALQWDPQLTLIARHHSADMRDHSFFEHESPASGSPENRLDRASYLFAVVRENLAEGVDVDASQDLLLKSPHHYDNIVALDITHLGIGIVSGGAVDSRNLTITQLFATPRRVQSPKAALKSLSERLLRERKQVGRGALNALQELSNLARQQIKSLGAVATSKSLGEVSQAVSAAMNRKHRGALQVLALTVTEPSQVAFPKRLLQCSDCSLGLATRRVPSERGRPLLQVLFVILVR